MLKETIPSNIILNKLYDKCIVGGMSLEQFYGTLSLSELHQLRADSERIDDTNTVRDIDAEFTKRSEQK